MPPEEKIHAHGNTAVVRRPLGHEVVGECTRCGLVRFVPFGVGNLETMW